MRRAMDAHSHARPAQFPALLLRLLWAADAAMAGAAGLSLANLPKRERERSWRLLTAPTQSLLTAHLDSLHLVKLFV